MIDSLAFLRKSAEPPRPFNILEPMAFVELAWAYYITNNRSDQLQSASREEKTDRVLTMSTSSGVFIAITPNLLMISGELATC